MPKTKSKSKPKRKTHICGRISPKALGTSLGALWGAYVFLLALILSYFPNVQFFWISKEFLSLLATLYPGYAATVTGALTGLFWGFLCGALGGALLAWLHNYALESCGD